LRAAHCRCYWWGIVGDSTAPESHFSNRPVKGK
jgi:hypothetical protein